MHQKGVVFTIALLTQPFQQGNFLSNENSLMRDSKFYFRPNLLQITSGAMILIIKGSDNNNILDHRLENAYSL